MADQYAGESPRRLGPDFVEEYRDRHGKRPPAERQVTYDIAVLDEYAPRRQWLDEQLEHLPSPVGDELARKVWLDEHFWSVHFELAVGAGLRAAGLRALYEQDWDKLTPDWTVVSDEGNPLAFVEVHTDMPASSTYSRMRAWHSLAARIKKIPVPVVLQLASNGPVSPPDAGAAKKIARDLERELLSNPQANVIWSQGYTFLVTGDPKRGGRQMASPLGMRACFDPPSSLAGPVIIDRLMEGIGKKVRKYKRLADRYGVPLVVAVGAHPFTGVTLEHLDEALNGLPAPKFTFQFSASDAYIGKQTARWVPVPPWRWPADLSGLLWIANRLPFNLTARPNTAPRRMMPAALAQDPFAVADD